MIHTIAPNVSTQREAKRIVRLCRWTDTTSVRDADAILVVVRSSGSSPLAQSYGNLQWLLDEANSQLNELGAQFHIYFYVLRPDHPFNLFQQVSHRSYDAEGSSVADPLARARSSCWF